mgnify:CR=1 FL=1
MQATLATAANAARPRRPANRINAIAHAGHRWLPLRRAIRPGDLALAGGAAGIAAAFNTPLAGIVFAVEELGRRLETRTSGVLISLVILAGLVSLAWSGDYRYFGQLNVGALTAHIAWAKGFFFVLAESKMKLKSDLLPFKALLNATSNAYNIR